MPSSVEVIVVDGLILGLQLQTHHVHVEFGEVHQWRTLISNFAEVLFSQLTISLVDTSALDNQQELVEFIKHLT